MFFKDHQNPEFGSIDVTHLFLTYNDGNKTNPFSWFYMIRSSYNILM